MNTPNWSKWFFRKTVAYQAEGDWPEMVGISSVLDFGGACGRHYKIAALHSPDIRWAVVETQAMAERASELATDRLRFFTDIAEASAWLGPIDMMHSSGALQYTPDPMATLQQLCALRAQTLLWSRMVLSKAAVERDVQVSHLVDNGHGPTSRDVKNKTVRYGRTWIPEKTFLEAHAGYEMTARGEDWFRFRAV